MREDCRHSAIIRLGKVKMASDFRRLAADCRLLTICDNCDTTYQKFAHYLRGKLMRIVARVMAWHFAPQKVRYCDNSPLKKWA